MFSFFEGRRFANDLADSLGIERNLLGTALLERGITWKHLKDAKRAGATLETTAITLKREVLAGLDSLEARFGSQAEIETARLRLAGIPSLAQSIAAKSELLPMALRGALLDSMQAARFSEADISETAMRLSETDSPKTDGNLSAADPDQRLGK